MNRALWTKAIADSRLLLGALATLLFGFNWLFVWLTSTIDLGAFESIFRLMPSWFERMLGIPMASIATMSGRIGLGYVHPVVFLSGALWGIARGSDSVSGQIDRGTMEMLLAQPVRRVWVLATHALVTTAGAVLLALAAWLGTCAGLATVPLGEEISCWRFLPAAVNLLGLTFFVAAIGTLASSWDSYRWRTIGLVGGFFVVELVVKLAARLVPDYGWLMYFTFLGAYQPQLLVAYPASAWLQLARYDATLLGLGLAAFVAAAVIFCRRDLPAPI